MADHFYSVAVPGATQGIDNVTKGTSTSGQNVELRIHDGASISKAEAVMAIQAIQAFIETDGAPA